MIFTNCKNKVNLNTSGTIQLFNNGCSPKNRVSNVIYLKQQNYIQTSCFLFITIKTKAYKGVFYYLLYFLNHNYILSYFILQLSSSFLNRPSNEFILGQLKLSRVNLIGLFLNTLPYNWNVKNRSSNLGTVFYHMVDQIWFKLKDLAWIPGLQFDCIDDIQSGRQIQFVRPSQLLVVQTSSDEFLKGNEDKVIHYQLIIFCC